MNYQSPTTKKMKNKAAETKTHLDARSAICSFPFHQSRGWALGSLLEDGENSREMPVGETGSLCFATCSEGQASGEKKSESIWSTSCRKLKTVHEPPSISVQTLVRFLGCLGEVGALPSRPARGGVSRGEEA